MRAAVALPSPLPADIRLMNAVSSLVIAGAVLTLVAAAMLWLARSPWFAIRAIEIDGPLGRNSVDTIRAGALPRLAGNFFSVDLQSARQAFESVPWVRRAVVRRVFPDRLAVTLEEHEPAALWQDERRGELLVNRQGELFEANVGDVDEASLPVFSGPSDSAVQLLEMHRRLQPVVAPLGRVDALTLSARGSWRLTLDSGAVVELGRGDAEALHARLARFVRTLPQLNERFPRQPLELADLRHADGYAVRLRGVTTPNPTGTKVPKKS